jgi:hypothetical protein
MQLIDHIYRFLTGEDNFKLAKVIGMEAAKMLAVVMAKVAVGEGEGARWVQISVKNECGFVLEKVSLTRRPVHFVILGNASTLGGRIFRLWHDRQCT